MVRVIVKDEVFVVQETILTHDSEYFAACLKESYREGQESEIRFDDIDPQHFAKYLGITACLSSFLPLEPPSSDDCEIADKLLPLDGLIDVYQLCDRFLHKRLTKILERSITSCMWGGYYKLQRRCSDIKWQQRMTKYFADGYEALDSRRREELGEKLIHHFVQGFHYVRWSDIVDEVKDQENFMAEVSKQYSIAIDDRTCLGVHIPKP